MRLPGRGMPVPEGAEQGGPGRYGDLYVGFRVVFPRTLTPQQKAQLLTALS